jgi:hypothetical protein
MAEWTPFQTHCYSENLAAPGIEPDTKVGVGPERIACAQRKEAEQWLSKEAGWVRCWYKKPVLTDCRLHL